MQQCGRLNNKMTSRKIEARPRTKQHTAKTVRPWQRSMNMLISRGWGRMPPLQLWLGPPLIATTQELINAVAEYLKLLESDEICLPQIQFEILHLKTKHRHPQFHLQTSLKRSPGPPSFLFYLLTCNYKRPYVLPLFKVELWQSRLKKL